MFFLDFGGDTDKCGWHPKNKLDYYYVFALSAMCVFDKKKEEASYHQKSINENNRCVYSVHIYFDEMW